MRVRVWRCTPKPKLATKVALEPSSLVASTWPVASSRFNCFLVECHRHCSSTPYVSTPFEIIHADGLNITFDLRNPSQKPRIQIAIARNKNVTVAIQAE